MPSCLSLRLSSFANRSRIVAFFITWIVCTGAFFPHEGQAADSLVINISLPEQQMAVRYSGGIRHVWPVSTGRSAYCTPAGTYRPYLLKRMHYSSRYDWAPMPFSIFFHRGYAIHGTTEIKNLGTPASHGCIRLHPENAEVLFNLVKQHGKDQTLIRIIP